VGRQYGIYLHALDQYSHFHNIIDRYVDTNDGYLVQVTQPVGYVKLCRVHNVIKSTAEWTARDFVCELEGASPPCLSIMLLFNCQ
jgi:hypothetical protein